jgi:hypothetical protein
MNEKSLAHNSFLHALSFALKVALLAISLNATINNIPELIRQN